MLDAMYKLGKLTIEKENLDEISVLLDEKNIGAVVLIEFNEDSNGNYSFEKVFQEDYDAKNKVKYLYKRGSSRGTDITPSCLVTDLDKTFNNKFLNWFKKNHSKNNLFEKLYDIITQNQDSIYQNVGEILDNISVKNANILLSIVISKDDDIYYLNDFPEFKDILIDNSLEKYYKSGSKKVKGEGVCCLCDEKKEVYGLVSNSMGFSFSTPEKVGNVPGNILENQWKLLPICGDCALYLNAGKNYVEKYLDFSDFGLRYYVIPNFLFDINNGFNILDSKLKSLEYDKANASKVAEIEDDLNILMKGLDDIIEFKFMFYQSSNSAFDILAYVESVIPSWINKLVETQENIVGYDYFGEDNLREIFKKDHSGNFIDLVNKNEKFYPCSERNWYWSFLRDFVSNFSRKIYIDLVTDIISNRPVDYHFLMSRFMDKIRSNWRNEENYALKMSVLKSLMLLILFNNLNLIRGGKVMSTTENFDKDNYLDTPSKKATFLLGVLTRKLMNVQFRELNSTPFYNKLWGLSLDEKKIQKLYPMVINKLREYDAAYPSIEEDISENFLETGNNWDLTRDETSYFFVLGFTLANSFKNKKGGDLDE